MTDKISSNNPEGSAGRSRAEGEADRWVVRHSEGPLDPSEARAFNAWLVANPEHQKLFHAGKAVMREAALMRGEKNLDALMRPSLYERLCGAAYDARQLCQNAMRPWMGWALGGLSAVATSILIILALTPHIEREPNLAAPAPLIETSIAELRTIKLPDGSDVTLGAATGFDVRFTQQERRVELRAGEAFFDVAKDPDRPFIVVADKTLVRVLGTKFDVNLGANAVDVAVLEGRVEVIRPEGEGAVIREEDVKHVLTAGQKVAAPKSGRVRPVETVDADNIASWRRGELVWVDEPVRDIIADINRYSARRILLENNTVAELEYTLAIRAEHAPDGARLLARSLGLEIHNRSNGDIVLR